MGNTTVLMNPKVSVMVVTYNHSKFIVQTLEGILNDDYANFEVIISDDASIDGTQDILKKIATKYSDKIKLILNEKNIGITKNCNKAFFASSGEYIILFAGDDVFIPGKISAQIEAFKLNPRAVLCYHPVEIFDSETGKTIYFTHRNPNEDTDNVEKIIIRGGISSPCSLMVKRSACPKNGFDSRLPTVSDWLFQIETALQGDVIKVNNIYAKYRKHTHGTSRKTLELLQETLYTLDLLIEKYPERSDLLVYCKKGKARYIAGEAFRQMSKNPEKALDFSRKAVQLDPENTNYKILFYLCWGVNKFRFLNYFFVFILSKTKFFIKRNI